MLPPGRLPERDGTARNASPAASHAAPERSAARPAVGGGRVRMRRQVGAARFVGPHAHDARRP